MDVVLGTLCDYASTTADGKVNILGVFTDLNPPGFPFVLPQAFVVVTLESPPSEVGTQKKIRLQLMGPDGGAPIFSIEQDVTIPSPPRAGIRTRINLIIGIGGLVFPASGDHALDVLVNGDQKYSIPLRVNDPVQ